MSARHLYLMTKSQEEAALISYVAPAYGQALLEFGLLLLVPAILAYVGAALMRGDRRFYSPPWMCPAWAAESDAYKLLFQEIYSAHDVRMSRLVVGGGAIAMQALVLILVLRHLHHKMVFSRIPAEKPILALEGRCVAFVMMTVRVIQGDTRRDLKMMRYAAEHPGPVLGNFCAFAIASIGSAIGLINIALGAVLIVKAPDLLTAMMSFAGLGFIMDIDNWFVNLFELSSNDLKWLEKEAFDYFDLNKDGVIDPEEFAAALERGSEDNARVAPSPPAQPPLAPPNAGSKALLATRALVFFFLYPVVFAYLWLWWIPGRSVPA
mmetsp:Transcript_19263/g.59296  ORF Transcript_19263/g.59296 Transcript_19263/m.59296 type:complete len:322 (+) Transcript_19263:171-1136(+)